MSTSYPILPRTRKVPEHNPFRFKTWKVLGKPACICYAVTRHCQPVCPSSSLGHITSSIYDFFLPCHLPFPLFFCFQFSYLITNLRHHPWTPSGLRIVEWRASLGSVVPAEDLATKLLWDPSKPLWALMSPEKWGEAGARNSLCLWYLSLGYHSRCQGSGETDC